MLLMAFGSCAHGQAYRSDFSRDADGWTGDFADYPAGDSLSYRLRFDRVPLPPPLDTSRFSLRIGGDNRSDDLFMFIKRPVTGLQPNSRYDVVFTLTIASNAPTRAVGIGGPPGEAVTVKAGVSTVEPRKTDGSPFYRMNIDKGNQIQPGRDMDTLGHIGVTDTTKAYAHIERTNSSHPFRFTTDSTGAAWLCIGTDSGFEGNTTLYYSGIGAEFDRVTSVESSTSPQLHVFPHPCHDWLVVRGGVAGPDCAVHVLNSAGQIVSSFHGARFDHPLDIRHLAAGSYHVLWETMPTLVTSFVKE
ncbi:MAG: hypothetical protein ACKOB6_03105 [Candidatus Kapaibacterium sp.]